MGKNQQLDKKTVFRSIVFIVAFWGGVALIFFGLFVLFAK